MPQVIGKFERVLVYGIVGTIDVLQIIFDFFVVTEPLNHIIDIVVGGLLLIYALKRKLLTVHKGLTIVAVFIAEQIPFVNALPFWTYDVHNLYKDTVKEPAPTENPEDMPFNINGVRQPPKLSTSLNKDGVRPPRKV